LLRRPLRRRPTDPGYADIERIRSEASRGQSFPKRQEVSVDPVDGSGPAPEPIWVCDRLWNRAHIGLKGEVRPCCIPGNPILGDLKANSFDEIWNGPVYRTMRARLIAKDPVPVCQGCQYISEIRDPRTIEQFLNGNLRPGSADLPDYAAATTGVSRDLEHTELIESVAAPVLEWASQARNRGYEIELSLDAFVKVAFCSSWHEPHLEDCRYEIPDWAWQEAPEGQIVAWRAIAYVEGNRVEVALGRLRRSPLGE